MLYSQICYIHELPHFNRSNLFQTVICTKNSCILSFTVCKCYGCTCTIDSCTYQELAIFYRSPSVQVTIIHTIIAILVVHCLYTCVKPPLLTALHWANLTVYTFLHNALHKLTYFGKPSRFQTFYNLFLQVCTNFRQV